MARIAYLGPAFAGKTTSLQQVAAAFGGSITSQPPHLELATTGPDGAVTLVAAPGRVFASAPRLAMLQTADAIVFVVDSRPDRLDATVEHFEDMKKLLADANRPTKIPV